MLAVDRKRIAWADLYTITLASGTVLRWSGEDREIPHGGQTWELGPGLDRDRVEWAMGLAASELKVNLYPHSNTYQVDGQSLPAALAGGAFDGATLRLDRGVAQKQGDALVGVIPDWFSGRIVSRASIPAGFALTVRTPLDLLDQPFPRNVYSPGCTHRLFDGGCGLNPDTYKHSTSVTSEPTRLSLRSTGLNSQGDHYYRLGRLQFTTGKNAGHARMVKVHTNATGYVQFVVPFPADIEVGDQFDIWPGCDRTQSTCSSKFSNIVHFRGQPYIPAAETVA